MFSSELLCVYDLDEKCEKMNSEVPYLLHMQNNSLCKIVESYVIGGMVWNQVNSVSLLGVLDETTPMPVYCRAAFFVFYLILQKITRNTSQ